MWSGMTFLQRAFENGEHVVDRTFPCDDCDCIGATRAKSTAARFCFYFHPRSDDRAREFAFGERTWFGFAASAGIDTGTATNFSIPCLISISIISVTDLIPASSEVAGLIALQLHLNHFRRDSLAVVVSLRSSDDPRIFLRKEGYRLVVIGECIRDEGDYEEA